jgi:hypothetical protein
MAGNSVGPAWRGETTELGREGGIESGAACAGDGDGGFDALAILGVEPGEHLLTGAFELTGQGDFP